MAGNDASAALAQHDLAGIDLAVIAASARHQADLACACGEAGIRAALLMNAYPREPLPLDIPDGIRTLRERCHQRLRIIGPQSFGLMSPHHGLNISPGLAMPARGKIAFISESSAMSRAVLDWSFRTRVGFSAMVACDVMPDVGWADIITHFGDDPQTKTIVVYLESVGDARAFLSAAREVALTKPIILLKSTRAAEVVTAAGPDEPLPDAVFDAALRRVGVLRVRSIAEMFYMANVLARQPLPAGSRLAVVTNSLAPALLATDSLLESGGVLATLAEETTAAIQMDPADHRAPANPLVLAGNVAPQAFAEAVAAVAKDRQVDGVLAVFIPSDDRAATDTAQALVDMPAKSGKPLLTSWVGASTVADGQEVLYRAGIPSFPYPDTPPRIFSLMWRHARNLTGIYETPSVIRDEFTAPMDVEAAREYLAGLRRDGVTVLNQEQSARVLGYYGIALEAETEPPEGAYRLLVGSRIDKTFGPYMVFGIGGRMSVIYEDIALGLPPLTSVLAHRMMEESAVWRVVRPNSDTDTVAERRVAKLQALLVRLSLMVVQQSAIRRLTINPLFVAGDEVLVNNCALNLHNPDLEDSALPRTAIRPYPTQYTWQETVRTGMPVIFRPVRPEDEPLIVEFHKLLSEETIYRRYFFQHKFSRRTSHERLRRTCFLDFDREIALAALVPLDDGTQGIAAVGRLQRNRAGDSAEVALLVADPYQGLGIGTTILRHLIDIAQAEGVPRLMGTMLPGNIHMQHLFGKLGFTIRPGSDDMVLAERILTP